MQGAGLHDVLAAVSRVPALQPHGLGSALLCCAVLTQCCQVCVSGTLPLLWRVWPTVPIQPTRGCMQ